MDCRRALLDLLASHQPADERERADLDVMRGHAAALAEPFSRDQLPAHFTASAVVVAPDGSRVCLVHHKKLGRWLQPGGHVEAGELMVQAALREAREETSLELTLHPRRSSPLDVDVHTIPARGAMAAHDHLDVRYLLLASGSSARHDPEESQGLGWFAWDEALALADEPAFVRMLEKARRLASL